MNTERKIIVDKKSENLRRRDLKKITELIERNNDCQNKKLYFFMLIMILINSGVNFYIYINKKGQKDKTIDRQIKSDFFQNEIKIKMLNFEEKIKLLESEINRLKSKNNEENNFDSKSKNKENIINNTNIQGEELPEISYEKFDENIYQEVKKQQMEFCNNQNKYIKIQFEKQIKLSKISLFNKSFDMYVYKNKDIVSNNIRFRQSWESSETKKIINALNYYSSLKNIPNDNIYIIDIGANVGWYTLFLGKYGYQIISFEASVVNNYILRKNFCLNPNLNISLINKGLFTEEKKCDYYYNRGNIGNGMIQCDKNNATNNESSQSLFVDSYEFIKSGEAYLTKLSNYVEFLSTKNVALIKIDIEGTEGKAIESGIELISNYHVPFIFLEFTPSFLKLHGTDPMQFLEMFEMNGYKFPKNIFFDNNYYTKEELVEKYKNKIANVYIVYSNIIKSDEKNITNNNNNINLKKFYILLYFFIYLI